MGFDMTSERNRGQVGISFLIVFIALVLVAAIAAGLFIQTAGVLEERASNTGEEATAEVSNQLDIISEYGTVNGQDTDNDGNPEDFYIDQVNLSTERAAGSGDIDLSAATIDYKNEETQSFFQYAQDPANPVAGEEFTVSAANDPDGSAPVLTEDDDLFVVTLHLNGDSTTSGTQELYGGDSATVTINTANGGERTVELSAPMNIPQTEGAIVEL